MDRKDWKILEHMCTDARMSHNQIARKVGLSKNTITYRIERLQKRGIITGFSTIINHASLDIYFYEVFLKLTVDEKESKNIISYLTQSPSVLVLDRLSGEWNLVFEFGSKKISTFFAFMSELKNMFSTAIDMYEIHPVFENYKVEQLPIELIKKRKAANLKNTNTLKQISDLDVKILEQLNLNSTVPLYKLAQEVGVTSETVRDRMRRLKKQHVLLRHTARISLPALGYDTFLVIVNLQKVSQDKEKVLRSYIIDHKNVRYAFMSGSSPKIFIYFAAKNTDKLDSFLLELRQLFSDIITNQKYLLVREQYKYNLFPAGLV